jgi:DNA repair photolyase
VTDKPDKYFPDQPIVRGADVIYRPAGNAGEYAPLATNPYSGCGHQCLYCYVPNAMHMQRPVFDAGAIPRKDFGPRLVADIARYRAAGVCDGHPADQVFITFSSDPWHPGDCWPTVATIQTLVEGGMSFCTLSKGGARALPFLHLYRRERDAYAATLTTLDERFSRKWERNAPLPMDRIATLRAFHEAGIFTWVSLEPTLDVDASMEIVRTTHGFVDLFKIGKANYLKEITRITDWCSYTQRMIELCQRLNVKHYIKRDLQMFLPPGYSNPLRVRQHHHG